MKIATPLKPSDSIGLPWHFNGREQLVDHLLHRRALDLGFRLADEAMAQDRVGERLDVVRRNEGALAQRGEHTRGANPVAPGAGTGPEGDQRTLARGGEQTQGVV